MFTLDKLKDLFDGFILFSELLIHSDSLSSFFKIKNLFFVLIDMKN
jgi:hypothetical protein